jgi:hypothetical protein
MKSPGRGMAAFRFGGFLKGFNVIFHKKIRAGRGEQAKS